MLRRFLLGILVVSLANLAWAGVPDLGLSTAVIPDGAAGASVFALPNGLGSSLDEAFADGGATVDATITLTLVDSNGDGIFLYPFQDLWLETSDNGLAYCNGGTDADASTDENGQTTWTNPVNGGGCSDGELVEIYVAGSPLSGAGLDITFNSADLNGDLAVNLADIVTFTQVLNGDYDYCADFNNDGAINLADIVRMTGGIGAACN